MRVHITLEDELVAELDRRLGPRRRSGFVAEAIRRALDDARRWDEIEAALDSPPADGAWDDAPGRWVREGRRADGRRVG